MNKVFVRLYAFVSSILMIATLGIFAYRLVNASHTDLAQAEKNFKYIANFISTNSETTDITSQEFTAQIKKLLNVSGNIAKAMLIDTENKVVFSWDAKTDTITKNAYSVEQHSLILKPYSMSITVGAPHTEGTKPYNFSAILKSLSDDFIYTGLRDCLFVFAVLFLITLMLLIINYLVTDSSKPLQVTIMHDTTDTEKSTDRTIGKLQPDSETKTYSLEDLADVNFSASAPPSDSTPYNELDLSTVDTERSGDFLTAARTNSETENDKRAQADTDFSDTRQPESSSADGPDAPQENMSAVYVQETGVSREEYLNEKLEFELGRATSSEQDLSLIIFMLKDVDKKLLKEVADILLHRFKFRDMVFHFSETGFAVIYHDANLEKSMQEAENAYIDILQILSRKEIGIGITTRSSRLVSAKRLIDEASSAVTKSFENSNSPIVAFRPDPQAYRDYIKDYT